MKESITIVLPLPSKWLSPNKTIISRGGRFAKAKEIRKYRQLAKDAVEACMVESAPWVKAHASVAFYWPDKRRRDDENAAGSLKAAFDGVVDSGLIIDDDYEHLRREMPTFQIDKVNPRVEITISNQDAL